ncbi:MAG TPA: AMP-binding protein, partial [Alcaligenaceae bacterium]|nr:AMP-binding protein [Alcaligenaceae bacterium]
MQIFFDDESQLAPARVEVEQLDNGGFILRSPEPLGPYARCVGEWLEKWAQETPDALYLAAREGDGWRELSYAQVRETIGQLAQGLLDLGLSSAQPLIVLSGNDLDHAMLTLAAMHVGIPIGTVSVAYSKGRKDYSKLTTILNGFNPGCIFVITKIQPGLKPFKIVVS